jgi:uncharacterized protein (TIGR00369 family)
VCGSNNDAGLRLSIVSGDGGARAEFQPDTRWEGYPGLVHGGLISAVLDDLMFHAISAAISEPTVTASMEVRFRHPARTCSRLYCEARVGERRHSKVIEASGEMRDQEGQLIATAKSKFIIMPKAKMDGFVGADR